MPFGIILFIAILMGCIMIAVFAKQTAVGPEGCGMILIMWLGSTIGMVVILLIMKSCVLSVFS